MASHGNVLLAVIEEDYDELNRLLRAGADANELDGEMQNTPLHEAAIGGSARMIEMLLISGANASAQNREGNTALHEAAGAGWDDCVRGLLLAANPAPINAQNRRGNTALHLCVEGKFPLCMEYLLWAGADMHGVNADGQTAIDIINTQNAKVRTKLLDVLHVEEARRSSKHTPDPQKASSSGRRAVRFEDPSPRSPPLSGRAHLRPISEPSNDVEEAKARAQARAKDARRKAHEERAEKEAQKQKTLDARQQIEEHLKKEREAYRAEMRAKVEARKKREANEQLKEKLKSHDKGREEGGPAPPPTLPGVDKDKAKAVPAGLAWEDTAFEKAKAKREHMAKCAAESRERARRRKEAEEAKHKALAEAAKGAGAEAPKPSKAVEAKVVKTQQIYGQIRVGNRSQEREAEKAGAARQFQHQRGAEPDPAATARSGSPVRLPAVGMTGASPSHVVDSDLLSDIHLSFHRPTAPYPLFVKAPDRAHGYSHARHGASFYSHVFPDLY